MFKLSRVKKLVVTDEHFTERNLLTAPPPPASPSHQKRDVTLKLKIAPEMNVCVYDEFDEELARNSRTGSFI